MNYVQGIPVWGPPLLNAVEQMVNCTRHPAYYRSALMGDHHLGYSVPVGGVIAYHQHISPSGVGFDIGCGNKAVKTDLRGIQLLGRMKGIMDRIYREVAFGIGQNVKNITDHELFHDDPAWSIPEVAAMKEKAVRQLGTVGSGNHYVDIFVDEDDWVWIGVHFGSRGLGHGIASHYIKAGGGTDGMMVEPVVFDEKSDLGEQYIMAMGLGGRYAYAGRDKVCLQVAAILGAQIVEEVHNHHNFAWKEFHQGEEVWVVRKGATPAFNGQKGFVGASMGEQSVILQGTNSGRTGSTNEQVEALYSTVHGAGRVLSRTQAAGKVKWKRGAHGTGPKRPIRVADGQVTQKMMDTWVANAGVELRGAGVDESPHCYKRLDEVLGHHGNTIEILHRLTPMGVAMAGPDVKDPYKD